MSQVKTFADVKIGDSLTEGELCEISKIEPVGKDFLKITFAYQDNKKVTKRKKKTTKVLIY